MALTHSYEIKLSGTTYEGEVEMGGSGVISYTQKGPQTFSGRMEQLLKGVFDEIGKLYDDYEELKKFEVKIK